MTFTSPGAYARGRFWERNDQARARAKKRALVRANHMLCVHMLCGARAKGHVTCGKIIGRFEIVAGRFEM